MLNLFQKISKKFLNQLDLLLHAFSGITVGLALAQFPQFLAQYMQRLGGHIDEAQRAAAAFKIPELTQRAAELDERLRAIVAAPPFYKIAAFLKHGDWEIAKAAWKNFTPGLTFSSEEIVYLILGCFLGMGFYGLLKYIPATLAGLVRELIKRRGGSGKEPLTHEQLKLPLQL